MAKIYWAIHGYPPAQNAGAEWMAKEINGFLQSKGHEIYVHNPQGDWKRDIQMMVPDLIITHLDLSAAVSHLALSMHIPCINVVHHTFPIPHLRGVLPDAHIVYNASWVHAECNYPYPSIIVHPPVNPERFQDISFGETNRYITLVNCNKDKGALIFQDIARAMPHKLFMAVKGCHGPQINLRSRNILQVEPVDDISLVLQETAILLVPSVYESYGRIALEAMACGIPVIATRTPGLQEALEGSDARLIKSRNHIPAWIENITYTSRDVHEISEIKCPERKAFVRAKWQQSLIELEKLHQLIISLTK